ncbi:hypothetical protein P9112_005433 [Eukaryota sp. TZLM1-RC]
MAPPSASAAYAYGSTITRSNGMSYNPNTSTLATVVAAAIQVFPASSSSYLITPANCATISCISIHPTGDFIAIGEAGGLSRVLVTPISPSSPEDYRVICTHQGEVATVAWNSSGTRLLSIDSSPDGNFSIHSHPSSTILASGSTEAAIYDVAWLSDSTFVTAGLRHIKFWKLSEEGTLEGRLGMLGANRSSAFTCIRYTSSGQKDTCFAVSSRGHLCQFGINSRIIEKWVDTKIISPSSLSILGKLIAVGGQNGVIRLFNSSSLGFVSTLPLIRPIIDSDSFKSEVPSVFMKSQVSNDVPDVLALRIGQAKSNEEGQFEIHVVNSARAQYSWNFDLSTKQSRLISCEVLNGQGIVPKISSLSLDGDLGYCFLSNNMTVSNISPLIPSDPDSVNSPSPYSKSIKSLIKLESSTSQHVYPTSFAMEQSIGLIGFSNGRLSSVDLNNGDVIKSFTLHQGVVNCVEIVDFQSNLIGFSAGIDRKVSVFSVATGDLISSFSLHSSSITSLATSPIKNNESISYLYLITGGNEGLVVFNKLELSINQSNVDCQSLSVSKVNPTTSSVLSIAYGPPSTTAFTCSDDGFLAIGTQDKRIVLYDVQSARTIRTFRPAALSTAPEPSKLLIDPTGNLLASAGGDRVVRLVDLKTGAVLSRCYGHASNVTCLVFDPKLKYFVSVGLDGVLFVWKLKMEVKSPRQQSEQSRPAVPINLSRRKLPVWARARVDGEESESSPIITDLDDKKANKWKLDLEQFGPVALPDVASSTPFQQIPIAQNEGQKVTDDVNDDVNDDVTDENVEESPKESGEEAPSTPAASFDEELMKTKERLLRMGIQFAPKDEKVNSSQENTDKEGQKEEEDQKQEEGQKEGEEISDTCQDDTDSVDKEDVDQSIDELRLSTLHDHDVGIIEESIDLDQSIDQVTGDVSVASLKRETSTPNLDVKELFTTPIPSDDEDQSSPVEDSPKTKPNSPFQSDTIPLETYRKSLQSFKNTFDQLLENFNELAESKCLSNNELTLASEFGDVFAHMQNSLVETLSRPSASAVLESSGCPLPVNMASNSMSKTLEKYSDLLVNAVLKKLEK